MMTFVEVPGIVMTNKTLVIVLFLILNSSTGLSLPRLDRLSLNILDGEVIVFWKPAQNATSDVHYNVQMTKLAGEWAVVLSCSGITKTFCNLSGHIQDYASGYKVRVQAVDGNHTSEWTVKKFLPNSSDLQPPSFTLYATSSTISINVHQKPILRQLFPFGVTYILHLKEIAKNDKVPVKETTVMYLTDDLDQESKTFSSLQWGVKYCVSVMVEGNGALSRSDFSPEQCLLLPEREWFVVSVTSLSVLGLMAVGAVSAIGLVCYLKRPAKIPVVLKSPVLNWDPLSVGDGPMEVVTDKGWFLSSHGTQHPTKNPQIKLAFNLAEENQRRPSQDSGVIVVCNAVDKPQTSIRGTQEDSGCGSMGETVYPQNDPIPTKTEDLVQVKDYHRQNPALHVPQDQIPSSPVLAQVVSGYRAGPPDHFSKTIVPEVETVQWREGKEDFSQDRRRTRVEITAAFPLLTSLVQKNP
ncbi:interleukin-10 receptor subunit alpha [Stigmatopora nigra]